MATRHVTYAYETDTPGLYNYATYHKNTEQDRIAEVEASGAYYRKFETTIAERELIDDNKVKLEIIDGEFVLSSIPNFDIMLAQNWPGGA